MPLSEDAQTFIDEVKGTYEELLYAADGRIQRGPQLWGQFTDVVTAYADGGGPDSAVVEKVNELAVARELALDPTLTGPIAYEPDILASGRKIDFVADRGRDKLYVEVKTVRPQGSDEDENYRAYLERRKLHPDNVNYFVGGDLGGTVYANSFRARSKFLTYSLDFESRLAEAKGIASGPGVLVFCGGGFHWSLDELEDFSDFYHRGHHRQDDPFALMETHHLTERRVALSRAIDHFAFLKRPSYIAKRTQFHFPVRGPWFLGPQFGIKKRTSPPARRPYSISGTSP